MGQDNNLGGAPGGSYCLLACEQWSSPLYCDSEHPQDVEARVFVAFLCLCVCLCAFYL